mgnify:FL=1
MKAVVDYGFEQGMWSIADVMAHLDAVIAQTPDERLRGKMKQRCKEFEAVLIGMSLPMLREFEKIAEVAHEVNDAPSQEEA